MRTRRTATAGERALYKDPEWLKYIEMNAEAGYLIKQESKLMSPAPFAPLQAAENTNNKSAGEDCLEIMRIAVASRRSLSA